MLLNCIPGSCSRSAGSCTRPRPARTRAAAGRPASARGTRRCIPGKSFSLVKILDWLGYVCYMGPFIKHVLIGGGHGKAYEVREVA